KKGGKNPLPSLVLYWYYDCRSSIAAAAAAAVRGSILRSRDSPSKGSVIISGPVAVIESTAIGSVPDSCTGIPAVSTAAISGIPVSISGSVSISTAAVAITAAATSTVTITSASSTITATHIF
ncbi:MAG TPA: hypothetical protein H9931_08165, partial [Candidatus Enterocloster excrementigallinarum]|nr:hypothetical protein [Candidatus Enterocloster excrementigallinarum]